MRDITALLAWIGSLSAAIVTDTDDRMRFAAAIESAPKLDAGLFSVSAIDMARVIGDSVSDTGGFQTLAVPHGLPPPLSAAGDVLQAVMISLAAVKVAWPSRPSARACRDRIGAAVERGLAAAVEIGADGADLYAWLSDLSGIAVQVVSELAANGVPVVTVRTGISLPSSLMAYHLYGDAGRAGDVVDVSRSSTPMLMPTRFQALSA